VVCDVGDDANFVNSQPIFEMGGALDAPKVFFRRRVKPLRLGKTGTFVLDAIQCGTGPDASGRFVWFVGHVREGLDFV
jgi:hypothetical protein